MIHRSLFHAGGRLCNNVYAVEDSQWKDALPTEIYTKQPTERTLATDDK